MCFLVAVLFVCLFVFLLLLVSFVWLKDRVVCLLHGSGACVCVCVCVCARVCVFVFACGLS